MESNKKVKAILEYADTLIGIKYTWWEGNEKDREDPFYYDDPKNINFYKKYGINCASFINILLHKIGVKLPPSNNKYKGGTDFWYNYFDANNKLKPFEYTTNYDIGTLFLRKYRDVDDQGHFSVFYSKYDKNPNMTLYGNIIHAYAYGGVGVTNLGQSHFLDDVGYYEYIVESNDWLNFD